MADATKNPPAGDHPQGQKSSSGKPHDGGRPQGSPHPENRHSRFRDHDGNWVEVVVPNYESYRTFNYAPGYVNSNQATPSVGANSLALPDGTSFPTHSHNPDMTDDTTLGTLTAAVPGMHLHRKSPNSSILVDSNGDTVTDADGKPLRDPAKVADMLDGDINVNYAARMAQNITDALSKTSAAEMIGPQFTSELEQNIRSKWDNDPKLASKSMTDVVADTLGYTSEKMLGAGRDHPLYLQDRLKKDDNIDLDDLVRQNSVVSDKPIYDMLTGSAKAKVVIDEEPEGKAGFSLGVLTPVTPQPAKAAQQPGPATKPTR